MALDTDITKPETRKPRPHLRQSRIARLILLSNFIGLVVLSAGSLILNELRAGLVKARTESLITQGEVIASVLSDFSTIGYPAPAMDDVRARTILKRLYLPDSVKAKLYDFDANLVADTRLLSDEIERLSFPDKGIANHTDFMDQMLDNFGQWVRSFIPSQLYDGLAYSDFDTELERALSGTITAFIHLDEDGRQIICVIIPIQPVSAVVGGLSLEASDLDEIIKAERIALMPFIGFAILIALVSSALLTIAIATPLRRLAIAADRVRQGSSKGLELPSLKDRKDEIGDLAIALEAMTARLFDRILGNERFAADVAHELKNPLTSIRSAVETFEHVESPEDQNQLRKVIASDIKRLDRLITDISNASRLEAEIARSPNTVVDLHGLLTELVEIYQATRKDKNPHIVFESATSKPFLIPGRADPLGQVLRNLIENARSFSPPNGSVRLTLSQITDGVKFTGWAQILVEDEGPGILDDKLENIFDRFYTDRPEGTDFGKNSGLGLSIAKEIISAHRGEIKAENIIDGQTGNKKGARFIICLPEKI